MAQVAERDLKVYETKKAPLMENAGVEVTPNEPKKRWSRHDSAYYKGKYARKRKGKSAKPIPNKSIKEAEVHAVVSHTENIVNGPGIIDKLERSPLPGNNIDAVSQVKRSHTGRKMPTDSVTRMPANLVMRKSTDSVTRSESPVDSEKSASPLPELIPVNLLGGDASEVPVSNGQMAKENQEHIVEELNNCHLHDANAIFNDLSYEEKLLLQNHRIEILKKKSSKYPSALFRCILCKFHCNTISICQAHIKSNNHVLELKERRLLDTMRLLPSPSNGHINALNQMVVETVDKFALTESERQVYLNVGNEISSFVAENFPGCSLTVYGSIATCLAMKESNIDLNLHTPPEVNGPTTLGAIAKAVSESSKFSELEKDFDEGRPSIHFVHKKTNVKCCVCLSKEETLKTTEIIAKYQTIDPRVHDLAVVFHKWAKLCKMDNYKNGMWPPHTFPLLLIYYLQQCEPPVLPVLHELKGDPEDDSYLDPSELEGVWKGSNNMSFGELWLGLLRFYAVDYAHSEKVICIRKKAPLKRSVKNWIGKRTAIEDPFSVKRNVSRTIIHNYSFKYIMMCFRMSYLYYGIPRTIEGPLFGNICPPYPKLETDQEHMKKSKAVSDYWLRVCKGNASFYFRDEKESNDASSSQVNGIRDDEEMDENSSSNFCPEKPADEAYIVAEELSLPDATLFSSHLLDDKIVYEYVAENGNKVPPTICTICTMSGHSKGQCPDARLPPLPVLPAMTDEYLTHLDAFCLYVYEEYSQKPGDILKRKDILVQLEEFIRSFYPDVQLSLFGSSANGFGFRNSDLDICLTFKNNSTGQGIDVADLIPKLVYKLRKMPTIRNIVPIPSAKVPIIKFKDNVTQLEGDISLYNTLAQHNTQLLQTYALIDYRVKVLGYVMKTFAKLCDICDASRGSLSSYAYILMVIYFLQQCNPPVVPVLQELTDVHPKPVCIKEGQDVWFFRDLSKLDKVWPDLGKNKLSVGALWLQMLRFYTEDFNFEEYAISIRQKQMVYKFEKLWFKKPMAIEDPFDINHNLGGALSRKMKLFIIKSLRKGRYHFGTPISTLPSCVKSWKDYFLNVSCLREGAPPTFGCHMCKKIGHKVRNCPGRANFVKEKRNKGDVRETKNGQAFVSQNVDLRRRPVPQAVNNNNGNNSQGIYYWTKGAPLVKDDRRVPIPPFTQQQHQVHPHIRMPPPARQDVWYSQNWYQMQRQMQGSHSVVQPGVMSSGNQPSENLAPPVGFMPTCAAIESSMTKGHEFGWKNAFRSADVRGQMYHEPCLSLSQYKRVCDETVVRNSVQGESQNSYGGAIPKVGPASSPRARNARLHGKSTKNDNRQNP